MAITKEQFYSYSGYSDETVNGSAVDFFLYTFQEMVEQELNFVFSLNSVLEEDKYNFFAKNSDSQNYITIGAWQESGLTIKKGSYPDEQAGTLLSDPLVEGVNYRIYRALTGFEKTPVNKDNPVICIYLFTPLIANIEFVRVYGVWGYSNGVPKDIAYLLYTAIKNAVEYNDSTTQSLLSGGGGASGGAIQKIKEYTTQTDFVIDVDSRNFARNYFLDFLSTENAQKILRKYKVKIKQSVRVL